MTVPGIQIEETDKEFADKLIQTYRGNIVYSTDAKSWYVWNQKESKWEMDEQASKVTYLWYDIAETFPKLIQTQDPKTPTQPNKFRSYALSSRGVQNILYSAQRHPDVAVKQAIFDSRPYELNTPNGIVDLKTGELLPPDKTSMHIKQTKVTPEQGTPIKWLQFLDDTFSKDKSTIDFVQLLMGVAIVGEVLEQRFPFAYGPQGSGKSTFFNTFELLLADYAKQVRPTLITKGQDRHPEEFAKLQGARVVIMAEPSATDRFDESKLKYLTGGDTVEGRFMGKGSFNFRPSHTLFLYGNDLLSVGGRGEGIWRRMTLLPFPNPIWNKAKRVVMYEDVLIKQEGPQILNWIIEGARKYFNGGMKLEIPEHIQEVTKEYEHDEDLLGQFIEDECVINPAGIIPHAKLYKRWQEWSEQMGNKYPLGPKQFGQALRSGKYGQVQNHKTAKWRGYSGIDVKEDVPATASGIIIKNPEP